VYGTGEVETLLRKAGKGYVLGVASNHVFRCPSHEKIATVMLVIRNAKLRTQGLSAFE
jgi:hypothetical protein